jgi:hypothetical protein
MRIICKNVYLINEHPNKEKCFEWIRENWHDLNHHSLQEFAESLKALWEKVGGELKWSIGTVPDRGQFISLADYNIDKMRELFDQIDELPLTGVCWDHAIIENAYYNQIGHSLAALHSDTEHVYSNDGLFDLCISNDYEFYENGEIA